MNPAYLAPILGFAASLLLGLMGSCAHAPARPPGDKAPPPILAPVQTVTLAVEFRGAPPQAADLYVCGWAAGADGGFSCIEYRTFQEQVNK